MAHQGFNSVQLGFAAPTAADIPNIGNASCSVIDPDTNAQVCTRFAIGPDYSYTRSTSLSTQGCNEVAGNVTTPYSTSFTVGGIEVRVTSGACTLPIPANGEIVYRGRFQIGLPGTFVIPYGNTYVGQNSGYWMQTDVENGWSKITKFSDQTFADPVRYQATMTIEPYSTGGGGNPLP